MDIKIEDYLSESDIKAICADEVKRIARSGGERVLTNMAYYAAHSILDEVLNEDAMAKIRKKALDVINNLSEHTVFRRKGAWDAQDSIAYIALQGAMAANKPRILEKVREAIEQHDYEKELKSNEDCIGELFVETFVKMFGSGKAAV